MFKLFKRKQKQFTYCYCPKCHNELVSSDSFVKDNDGIAIKYPNILSAYGYDVHGSGSNGLNVRIRYCPMCGREIRKKR